MERIIVQRKRLPKINLYKDFFKDPDRKSLFQIVMEIITLAIFHRNFPRFYFSRYLFKKGHENIRDFFPSDYLDRITSSFNEKAATIYVENKLFFDFYYKQLKIRLPNILMYNHKKMFVVDNNMFEINHVHDFKVHLENIFNRNSQFNSIIIKKTYGSYGGNKIYKLYRDQCNTDNEFINEIYSEVIKSGFLFQETIIQHPELNKLNPSCINSIRFDAFIDSEGKIEIISCLIRTNVNSSHLDNISKGGYGIGINLHNGKLKKYGYCLAGYGIKILSSHPVTGLVFENFEIPFFNEAKELVLKAAGLMPGLRLVGWDVAIDETGPILIEGNSAYGVSFNEFLDGGYRANVTYQKVLKEYKSNRFKKK